MAAPSTKPPTKQPQLPLYSWRTYSPNARLVYLRDHQQADNEIAQLNPGLLGFDLEWRPTYVKGYPENPVALVQLASDNTILLLQIKAMREFPQKLRELLEDPAYIKTGVGIQNDALKLYRDWDVSTYNCVDLSLLARTVDNARWKGKYKESIGLSRLMETYHSLSLAKGRTTRSNWEKHLSFEQQEYASNDAHAGFVLYKTLSAMFEGLPKPPKPEYYSFHAIRGNLYNFSGVPWSCHNPDYDPGPPPEPKKPKKPKISKDTDSTATAQPQPIDAQSPNARAPSTEQPNKRPRPPRNRQAQQHGARRAHPSPLPVASSSRPAAVSVSDVSVTTSARSQGGHSAISHYMERVVGFSL
ncbi:ribonuclease H-like protein [Pluteus cervinus]|uniref:Ribonuclease H-like protein n=1 Tax=Pluteus cervinus TaxID=181527 RepID=A0ACD3BFD2_9AGAR|nr:ribonuclease H-like protein [Pluteus cervinus]